MVSVLDVGSTPAGQIERCDGTECSYFCRDADFESRHVHSTGRLVRTEISRSDIMDYLPFFRQNCQKLGAISYGSAPKVCTCSL